MLWLIFGGSGQLGLELSSILRQKGHEFLSIGSSTVDITNKNQVLSFIDSVKPNYIVNSAAWTEVDLAEVNEQDAYAINALGAKNIAQACQLNGSILIHISTDYVFSGDSNDPWAETSICKPKTAYGRTKLAAEVFINEIYPHKSYIFRTAWHYSRFGHNFVKSIIQQSRVKDIIKVVNDQLGQPTSANDLASQIINSVLAKVPFGTYHGTNSGEASWFDFASKIIEFAQIKSVEVVPVKSTEFNLGTNRPKYSVLGHNKWAESNFPRMRNWEVALREEIPRILQSL